MAGLQRQPSRRDPYKLTGVKATGRVLGSGTCTTDVELEYVGLKCVGKKIHQALFMQGETAAKVRQLKEQCHLLSQIRHPNIAMFLGLFFQQSPILVMECIPYSLASCIEQYGILTNEVSYSILHGVALGLSYLHSQTPAIIHGELTANNVLLTSYMTAKISYLGVAKILGLTQAEISNAPTTTDTSVYQAPEVMNRTCQSLNLSTDIYACGILMIYTLTGSLPHQSSSGITGLENLPASIDGQHPVMKLLLKCTNIDPKQRSRADDVAKELKEMVPNYPPAFAHRLELLKQIGSSQPKNEDEKEQRIMQEKIKQNTQHIQVRSEELKRLLAENETLRKQVEIDSIIASKAIQNLQQLQYHGQQPAVNQSAK